MMELSYRRHRFPPVVIQHAVWLYLRFTLSYRDVEDLRVVAREASGSANRLRRRGYGAAGSGARP
jgi:transposase-like protein